MLDMENDGAAAEYKLAIVREAEACTRPGQIESCCAARAVLAQAETGAGEGR